MSTQNIRNFITAASDTTYLYENTDIDRIAPLLLQTHTEHVQYIGAIGRGNIGRGLDPVEYSRMKILDSLVVNDTINKFVGIYNTGSNHWISFIIYRNHDLQSMSQASQNQAVFQGGTAQGKTSYMVWFKDSLGGECRDFQDDMRSILGLGNSTINVFSFNGREQILEFEPYNIALGTHIHTNCGIFALKNMMVLATKTPIELIPDIQGFFLQNLSNADLYLSAVERKHNYEQAIEASRVELPKFYVEHGGIVSEGELLDDAVNPTKREKATALEVQTEEQKVDDSMHDQKLQRTQTMAVESPRVVTLPNLPFIKNPIPLLTPKTQVELEQQLTLARALTESVLTPEHSVIGSLGKVELLKRIELANYKTLIVELAHNADSATLKSMLVEILSDLGALSKTMGDLNKESGDINSSLKCYTDAAVFYQYIISIIEEQTKLKVNHEETKEEAIEAPYTKEFEVIYEKLDQLRQNIVSTSIMFQNHQKTLLSTTTTSSTAEQRQAAQVSTKDESLANKAILTTLRTYTKSKLREIENYRSVSRELKNDGDEQTADEQNTIYVNSTRLLFEAIATNMKDFLARLYIESETELSQMGITKPCNYSVMGLGSMALNQMTPYSDLEFAILIEHEGQTKEEREQIKQYFRNLTHLVNFKIINLGETIIPTSRYDIDMSHLVHVGVNLDLGGKTPLGRIDGDKPYELIGTKEWLMHYVRNKGEKASHIDKNLPYILENTTHVYGNESLTKDYQEEVTKFLSSEVTFIVNDRGEVVATEEELLESKAEPYMVEGYLELFVPEVEEVYIRKITMHHCEVRALKVLKEGATEINYIQRQQGAEIKLTHFTGDLLKLAPVFGGEEEGKLFDVKQEIYRLPDRMIYNLGMYFGVLGGSDVLGSSAWNTIDKLLQQNIITQKAASNLKNAITFATLLRLQTYSNNEGQRDDMSTYQIVLEHLSEEEKQKFTQQTFYIKDTKLLHDFYYVMLRVIEIATGLCNVESRKEAEEILTQDNLYADTNYNKGMVHARFLEYDSAVRYMEEAREEKPDDLYALNDLLFLYHRTGSIEEAVALGQEILQLTKTTNSENPNHPYIAMSCNNLGMAYAAKGEHDKAIDYFNKALSIRCVCFATNPNHPSIAMSYNNLGNAYEAKGEHGSAIACFNKALNIMFECFGSNPNHPDIASYYNNLGNTYRQNGEHDSAIKYHTQALAIRLDCYALNPNHPDIVQSYNNLGNAYGAKGKHDSAIDCFNKALAIELVRFASNPNHHYVAMSYNNLGIAYRQNGEYDSAIENYNRALAIRLECFASNPNHPDIAGSYNNLGNAYAIKGEYEKAIENYNKALAIELVCYKSNPNHPSIAMSYNNLGNAYRENEEFDSAMENYNKALAIRLNCYALNPNHPDIAMSYNNLGIAYASKGEYDRAIDYFNKALDIRLKCYESSLNHPDIAMSYNNLGNVYYIKREYDEAIENYNEALAIELRCYTSNPNHPGIAMSCNNLGMAYAAKGEHDKAIDYFNKALAIKLVCYVSNPNHPHLISCYNDLRILYQEIADDDKAIECLREIHARHKAVYGDDHPSIIEASINLQEAYLVRESRPKIAKNLYQVEAITSSLEYKVEYVFKGSIEYWRLKSKHDPSLVDILTNVSTVVNLTHNVTFVIPEGYGFSGLRISGKELQTSCEYKPIYKITLGSFAYKHYIKVERADGVEQQGIINKTPGPKTFGDTPVGKAVAVYNRSHPEDIVEFGSIVAFGWRQYYLEEIQGKPLSVWPDHFDISVEMKLAGDNVMEL